MKDFFFLMIRRPPRSTLFPTRRSSDLDGVTNAHEIYDAVANRWSSANPLPDDQRRSEEHTSELQSRLHLVCRLLLEKKKTNSATPTTYSAPPDVPSTTTSPPAISTARL